jgi:phage repressor protein C with HTH and peptisase S24 domain
MKNVSERVIYMMQELGIVNNVEFGRLAKASRSVVGQWISGQIKSIAPEYAFNIQTNTKFNARWIMLGEGSIEKEGAEFSVSSSYQNSVELPLLNIQGSMGGGKHNLEEVVVDVLRVTKTWVNKTLSAISSIENLSFIHAIGDSMNPTFNDGDILLIDSGIKSVSSDSVYVLEAHDRLFIKRVRRRMDGTFEISSDNPAVKTVDILDGKDEVMIKGRVVWVWNGKRV